MEEQKRNFNLKYERLLKIDALIRDKKASSASAIAKKLEVSKNTVLRDIEFMRNFLNAPIEYNSAKKLYLYTENSFFLPAIISTEKQIEFSRLSLSLLTQYTGSPFYKPMKTLFDEIIKYTELINFENQKSIGIKKLNNSFCFFPEPVPRVTKKVWSAILNAIIKEKQIRILYKSPTSEKEKEHILEPYQFISKAGVWYLVAKPKAKDKLLTFALHRIKDITILKEKFTKPKDFNYKDYTQNKFSIFKDDKQIENACEDNSKYNCEIKFFDEAVDYISEREWYPNQKIEKQKDGSIILKFSVGNLYETLCFILSQGSNALPLAPEELVAQWKNNVEGMMKLST